MEDKTKGKTFKERYTTDAEYKKKHNEYITEKIECDCGRMVMRVAMAKHKRTAIHQKLVNDKNNEDIEELVDRLVKQKLKDILNN